MRSVLALALLLLSAATASAQTIKEELSQTRAAIESSEAKSKELAKQRKSVEAEMEALQTDMVAHTKKLRAQEKKLGDAEDKLSTLKKEETQKTNALEGGRRELSSAISGMIRLGRMPPEAVMAMPGEYRKSLRTAKALGITSQGLHDESQTLKIRLQELASLKADIAKNVTALKSERDALTKEQTTLKGKIKERSKLQSSIAADQKKLEASLSRLSKKSKSLKELIDSLDSAKTERESVAPRKKYKTVPNVPGSTAKPAPRTGPSKKLRSFASAKGRISLPVNGKIAARFGQSQGKNNTSKGLKLSARSDAVVSAPFDAEAVFTGPFLDYGRMVILRHSDGFHTLLAGFERIDIAPGQFLLEGEPIGAMGKGDSELYMELRRNNKPVDPADWLERRFAKR